MAIYKLQRKTFSEENGQKSSFGKKLAIAGGTAAAIGGGLYGAKKGVFGAGAQRWTGEQMMNLGMKKSGAKTITESNWTKFSKANKNDAANMTQDQVNAWKKDSTDKVISRFDKKQAAKNTTPQSN